MYKEDRFSHNWLAMRLANKCVASRIVTLSGLVLDLGCGCRPFEQDILEYAEKYVGVDWNNSLHDLRVDIIADLNRTLPLADNSVDHIVSFEVLEHLAEPVAMLREACRVLRSHGTLTLSVPFQWWVHEEPWDYYRYTRYGLEYILRKAGFVDIYIKPTSGFWSMWVLKLNYHLANGIRGPKPVRLAQRIALFPFLWCNQMLAWHLDRYWLEERETVGYFVTALKS